MDRTIELPLETILNREAEKALQCSFCGYMWTYRGKLIFASCPSCRRAVKVKNLERSNLAPRVQTKDQIAASVAGGGSH